MRKKKKKFLEDYIFKKLEKKGMPIISKVKDALKDKN